jgi:glycosyltransferase involved in cell wall biosynthesis
MPLYNEERHLPEALDCVLAQDYDQFELIISDNVSEDRTSEVCREYAAKHSRIRYFRNERNVGANTNFKRVFELARGEYFTWFSGHDLHEPGFLSRCTEILAGDPSVVMAYPDAVWVDEDDQVLGPMEYHLDTRFLSDGLSRFQVILWDLGYCYLVYGVYRSATLQRASLGWPTVGADVILLSELAFEGAAFTHVPDPLLSIRKLVDYGDWDKYVEKCLSKGALASPAGRQFWKMLSEYCRATVIHVDSLFVKGWVIASVVVCMLTKYRWIRHFTQEASKQ